MSVIAKEFLTVNAMSDHECWSALREALAVEALRNSGFLRLQVRGESMLPALWPGDVVEIASCTANQMSRDEIVLAFRDGRFFLHRFVAASGQGFITRGDSMPKPDPAFAANELLGKVVSATRDGREITPRQRPWSRLVGHLLAHSDFARQAALKIRGRGKPENLPAADLETA